MNLKLFDLVTMVCWTMRVVESLRRYRPTPLEDS